MPFNKAKLNETIFQSTAAPIKRLIIWVLFQHPHLWNELFYLLHSRRYGVTWLSSWWWLAARERL